MIAVTTENPAIPVSFNDSAFSKFIPPMATIGIFTVSTSSFNSSFVIEGASSLVAVGNTAPEPI